MEAVVKTFKNALASDKIAHAYLFSGPRGVGKPSTARILAKALNCAKGPLADPCYACASCVEISKGSAIDVFEIDGASNNGVEDVRNIRDAVRMGSEVFHTLKKELSAAGLATGVGDEGEIAIRCDGQMIEFWENPEATAERMRGDWVLTGDIGRIDANGYLYVLDRKDDMIIPSDKEGLVEETRNLVKDYEQQYQDGLITQQEKMKL